MQECEQRVAVPQRRVWWAMGVGYTAQVGWHVVKVAGSHVKMGSSLATMRQAAHEGECRVTAT